jgi:uncharacterized protein YwqG
VDSLYDTLLDVARAHLPVELADEYMAVARPAIRMNHASRATGSWLGGEAMLDPGTEWPRWGEQPLALICVLEVDELGGLQTDAPLPDGGILNFFYESREQQAWGFDPHHRGGWRVIPADPGSARLVTPPPDCDDFGRQYLVPEQVLTIPDFEDGPVTHASMEAPVARRWPWSRQQGPEVNDTWERYEHFAEAWDRAVDRQQVPYHQIGGWPRLQQGSIWRECHLASQGVYLGGGAPDLTNRHITGAPEDWRLLLQVDTDEDVGWMWGDLGTLFYAAKPATPSPRRWQEAWMVLQCG